VWNSSEYLMLIFVPPIGPGDHNSYKEKNIMVNIDAIYRRARRDIQARDWIKPYLLVRPSEGRRALRNDFLNGLLNIEEENAIRHYLDALEQAEAADREYPTWNEFLIEETKREDTSEREWLDAVLMLGLDRRADSQRDSDERKGGE